MTERRAFISTFVEEVVDDPGRATIRTLCRCRRKLPKPVLSTVTCGGRWRTRTSDLMRVKHAL